MDRVTSTCNPLLKPLLVSERVDKIQGVSLSTTPVLFCGVRKLMNFFVSHCFFPGKMELLKDLIS